MGFEFGFVFWKEDFIFVLKYVLLACAFVFVKTFQEEFRSVMISLYFKMLFYIYI